MGRREHPAFLGIESELKSLDISDADCSAVLVEFRRSVAAVLRKSEAERRAADVSLARRIHAARLRANGIFGERILCDPKFEMLLDLFVSEHDGRTVFVGDLCLAADVPPTTGLRHLEKLAEIGFVRCAPDPGDGRRRRVEATERALSGISEMMRDLRRRSHPPIAGP